MRQLTTARSTANQRFPPNPSACPPSSAALVGRLRAELRPSVLVTPHPTHLRLRTTALLTDTDQLRHLRLTRAIRHPRGSTRNPEAQPPCVRSHPVDGHSGSYAGAIAHPVWEQPLRPDRLLTNGTGAGGAAAIGSERNSTALRQHVVMRGPPCTQIRHCAQPYPHWKLPSDPHRRIANGGQRSNAYTHRDRARPHPVARGRARAVCGVNGALQVLTARKMAVAPKQHARDVATPRKRGCYRVLHVFVATAQQISKPPQFQHPCAERATQCRSVGWVCAREW